MAFFDQKLWTEVGARLASALPATRVDAFAMTHGLEGVRLDRIAHGRKGTSVETLVKICEKLDLSPSWLLFGKGPRRLTALGAAANDLEWNLDRKTLANHILEGATLNVLERTGVAESPAEYDEGSKAPDKTRSNKPTASSRTKGRASRHR